MSKIANNKKNNKGAKNDSAAKPFTGILIGLGSLGGVLLVILIYLLVGNQSDQTNAPLNQTQQSKQAPAQTNTDTGPAVAAAWEKVGEVKGELQTLLFDPKDPKIAYLSTEGQGIYRSLDGGTSWELLGPSGKTMLDLSIDESSGRLYGADTSGVLYSDDQGTSWKQAEAPAGEAHAVQVDPRNPEIIWVGYWLRNQSGSTIYVSKDGGESFEAVKGGPQGNDINFIKFDEESKDTYVGTYGAGLFKTSDQGKSWQALNDGLNTNTDITLLTWTEDKSVFYVGTHDFGTFRSTDKGKSWQAVNKGKESANDVHGLVADPNNPDGVFAAGMMMGKGIFKSSNKGDTWQPVQADGINLEDVHIFTLNPEKTHIYLGSGEHGEGKGIIYRLAL